MTEEEINELEKERQRLKKIKEEKEKRQKLKREVRQLKREAEPDSLDKAENFLKGMGKGFKKTFDKLVPPLSEEEKKVLAQKRKRKNKWNLPSNIDVMGNTNKDRGFGL